MMEMQIDTSSVASSRYPDRQGRRGAREQYAEQLDRQNYMNGAPIEEFRFPLKKEQLYEQPPDSNRFWVKVKRNYSMASEDQMNADLEEIYNSIHGSSQCLNIMDNDNFDRLYSLIFYLESTPPLIRVHILTNLSNAVKSLLGLIDKSKILNEDTALQHRRSLMSNTQSMLSSSAQGGPKVDINLIRNSLKAYVYLLTFFLGENSRLKESKEAQSKVRRKNPQAQSNQASSAKLGRGNSMSSHKGGDKEINCQVDLRERTVQVLKMSKELLGEMEIKYLWKEQKVEEDFIKAYVKMAFDLLENPNNTKFQDVKENIFEILTLCMERFGQDLKYMQSQNTTKIIDLLYNQDNLAPYMAEFVGLVADKQGPQMPNDIIRELIGQIFSSEGGGQHESNGIKNISVFMKKLSKVAPKIMYQNIGTLISFFECESYYLRQALIKILSYIIINVLSVNPEDLRKSNNNRNRNNDNDDTHKMEDIDDEEAQNLQREQDTNTRIVFQKTKDKFLDMLVQRFNDKSSFCRSKAIKAIMKLLQMNVLVDDSKRHEEILAATINRLRDQTAQVRKNALRLYNTIVYVFGIKYQVDIKTGKGFFTLGEMRHEIQECTKDKELMGEKNKDIQNRYERFKETIARQTGAEGEALNDRMRDTEEYRLIASEYKECKAALEDNQSMLEQLVDYAKFLKMVNDSIDSALIYLLASKTQMDTIETIKLFSNLYLHGIEQAEKGIKKMLTLLFASETNVSQAVFDSYKTLYFSMSFPAAKKAYNLLRMVIDATLTDLTCMEELIKRCMANNTLEPEVLKFLLEMYERPQKHILDNPARAAHIEKQRKDYQRAALKILRMVACSKVDHFTSERKSIMFEASLKFARVERPDFILIQEALLIYEKVIAFNLSKKMRGEGGNNNIERLSQSYISESDNKYLQAVMKILVRQFGTTDPEWYCAVEALLNTVFNLKTKNSPEYAKVLLQELTKRLYQPAHPDQQQDQSQIDGLGIGEELKNQEGSGGGGGGFLNQSILRTLRRDINDFHYAQLFFVAGHVAIKMLTYIEQIDNELKKSGAESFNKQPNRGNNNNNGDNDNSNRREGEESKKEEDELDQIAGGKEAEIEQYSQTLKKIVEESLIQDGMLGKFLVPIESVVTIILSQQQTLARQMAGNPEDLAKVNASQAMIRVNLLQRSAIMALCKYMCVSEQICQKYIVTLFEILKTRVEFGVKANIIISLGDMCNRFPNTLHEHQRQLFDLLRDPSNNVRRQALLVITHLVLNDMLKLKGEIVDICMLLKDPDLKIQDQVKLFLHELNSKGANNIYNLFPKAISRLSKEFKELSLEDFTEIAKNLLQYIDKDKQTESIVERLCNKFRSSENPIEWRNTAYCLTQLKITEKIFIKLLEFYETCYKDTLLISPEVQAYFIQIATTLKKQFSNKPDLRKYLEEFESKVTAGDEQAQAAIKQNQLVQGVGSLSKTMGRGGVANRSKKVPAAAVNVNGAQQSASKLSPHQRQDGDDEDIADAEEIKQVGEFQVPNNKKRKFAEISKTTGRERESMASMQSAAQRNQGQGKGNGGGGGRVAQNPKAKQEAQNRHRRGGGRHRDDDSDEYMDEDGDSN